MTWFHGPIWDRAAQRLDALTQPGAAAWVQQAVGGDAVLEQEINHLLVALRSATECGLDRRAIAEGLAAAVVTSATAAYQRSAVQPGPSRITTVDPGRPDGGWDTDQLDPSRLRPPGPHPATGLGGAMGATSMPGSSVDDPFGLLRDLSGGGGASGEFGVTLKGDGAGIAAIATGIALIILAVAGVVPLLAGVIGGALFVGFGVSELLGAYVDIPAGPWVIREIYY